MLNYTQPPSINILKALLSSSTALIIYFLVNTPSFAKEEIPFYLSTSFETNPALHSALQLELNKAGLRHLKVTNTDFWHPFIQGIRQGRTGIYFAAPHFSAWAIKKHEFVPLLKLSGSLQYVLLSRQNDIDIFEVSDLARKRICSSKAPNLDFILANSALPSSFNSPIIISKASTSTAMISGDKDCDAFVVSEHIFSRYALKNPYRFVRLQQSVKQLNHAFISSPDIDLDTLTAFKRVMLSKVVVDLLEPLFYEYSSKPILIRATDDEFGKIKNDYLDKIWLN
jgi:hypothetical protein